MSFIRELWAFMRVRKKFWLLPIFVMMALFGGLVVFFFNDTATTEIYTIF
jgi:hypothetical protein